MQVKVKICGIRSYKAAQAAFDAGADFLGFNFIPSSTRFIKPDEAKEIIGNFLTDVKMVGVFQNQTIKEIKEIIDFLKLDFVQLHGNEAKVYSRLTQYAGVIKSFMLESDFDTQKVQEEMDTYNVDSFLLDRKIQGEGPILNFHRVRELSTTNTVILSGGLTAENVSEAIKIANPFAVDVASGIETEGREDVEKIREFIEKVHLL